jgi:hypothetical protein
MDNIGVCKVIRGNDGFDGRVVTRGDPCEGIAGADGVPRL